MLLQDKPLIIVDVDKGRDHKTWVLGIEDRGLETPIAVSQQHTVAPFNHDQVEIAVCVQVSDQNMEARRRQGIGVDQ